MFDKSAIEAITEAAAITAASEATSSAFARHQVVHLPEQFKTHDLEAFLPGRRRARGTMSTELTPDFAKYVEAHAEPGTTVFVDKASMKAVAVLNLGIPSLPGHADNKATLALKSEAAYDALLSIANGQAKSQTAIAEWMEDWAHLIDCFTENESGIVDMSTSKAIAAVRNITIEAARKVESQESQLSASSSAFESVKASSKHQLPVFIHVSLEPYLGLGKRMFRLRLGILTGGDKTTVVLRVIKMEEHQQEMAQEFAAIVNLALEHTAHPVLIGNYTAGK
jgi:uncharacterized protein YfdQ (DUF2303 family)